MKNEILFQRIKKLVATERRIGIEILECLYQIEIRKAYAELRYDGLYAYCVKELGFTEMQAFQRIQAMHALKDVPELKSKIESGALSVSAVAKVQTHLRREKRVGVTYAPTERLELFEAMENRTSREIEAKLAEIRGEIVHAKLIVEMDEELVDLWSQVKGLTAHRDRGSDTEVLKLLARSWLDRNHPARKPGSSSRRSVPFPGKETLAAHPTSPAILQTAEQTPATSAQAELLGKETSSRNHPSGAVHEPILKARNETLDLNAIGEKPRRFIRQSLKREIWKRDHSKCTQCGSTYALEIDHRIPFARGGKSLIGNLRLLCRSCNRHAAIRSFGLRKMTTASRCRKA